MNSSPFIVNLAPTGMVPTRAMSAHVPLSVEEIVEDAGRCIAAGASMVHLHARDGEGTPTNEAAVMREIVLGIRERHPEAIITVTTSGRRVSEVAQRAASLMLEGPALPDMASLTLGSMNFMKEASVNAPATIQRLAEIMKERGIKPELEVFDLGMLNTARTLIDKGLVEPPFYFNVLLGNINTAQVRLTHLAALAADLPAGSVWVLAGLGRFQRAATALGAIFADGARVGLEDSLHLDAERQVLATNVDLVKRAVDQATAMGRSIATPAQVRERLGLRRGKPA